MSNEKQYINWNTKGKKKDKKTRKHGNNIHTYTYIHELYLNSNLRVAKKTNIFENLKEKICLYTQSWHWEWVTVEGRSSILFLRRLSTYVQDAGEKSGFQTSMESNRALTCAPCLWFLFLFYRVVTMTSLRKQPPFFAPDPSGDGCLVLDLRHSIGPRLSVQISIVWCCFLRIPVSFGNGGTKK